MSFEIVIDDPREIRNVSETVFEKANQLSQGDELYVGLIHDHYSIVRGRNESRRTLDKIINHELERPIEIFREDGGESWLHSPESRCVEKAERIDPSESKSHQRLMAEWGKEIEQEVKNYLEEEDIEREIDPEYDSGDVYDANTGKQIGGLSMEIHEDKALSRLCFYEDNHEEGHDLFHQIIEADINETEEELDDLRKNYIPLPSFYKYLMPEETLELEVSGELSSGTEVPNPRPADYCISRQPS